MTIVGTMCAELAQRKKTGKRSGDECCTFDNQGCCKVEAVVSLDDRGQLVLPKEVRSLAMFRPGDKLAVITMRQGGKVCCVALMRTEAIDQWVHEVLGPLAKDIVKG